MFGRISNIKRLIFSMVEPTSEQNLFYTLSAQYFRLVRSDF